MPDRQYASGHRQRALADAVGNASARKLQARQAASQEFGNSLGFMGLIGWSVTTPTLLGVVLGHWLDGGHPGRVSWTLTLMTGGIGLGCFTAWYWIARESRKSDHHGAGDDA